MIPDASLIIRVISCSMTTRCWEDRRRGLTLQLLVAIFQRLPRRFAKSEGAFHQLARASGQYYVSTKIVPSRSVFHSKLFSFFSHSLSLPSTHILNRTRSLCNPHLVTNNQVAFPTCIPNPNPGRYQIDHRNSEHPNFLIIIYSLPSSFIHQIFQICLPYHISPHPSR